MKNNVVKINKLIIACKILGFNRHIIKTRFIKNKTNNKIPETDIIKYTKDGGFGESASQQQAVIKINDSENRIKL
jgi:hypothetical protein